MKSSHGFTLLEHCIALLCVSILIMPLCNAFLDASFIFNRRLKHFLHLSEWSSIRALLLRDFLMTHTVYATSSGFLLSQGTYSVQYTVNNHILKRISNRRTQTLSDSLSMISITPLPDTPCFTFKFKLFSDQIVCSKNIMP